MELDEKNQAVEAGAIALEKVYKGLKDHFKQDRPTKSNSSHIESSYNNTNSNSNNNTNLIINYYNYNPTSNPTTENN